MAAPAQPIDWMNEFRPFTYQHAVCVAACLAVMTVVALIGRRHRGTPTGDVMRKVIGWTGVIYWIGSNAWWNWPGNFDLAESLPIQVCDLAGIIGPIALLTRNRRTRAVLYFWGFALSTQGFITPVETRGAAYVRFWLFWANHTIIVGTALYDLVALDFRPRFRDFLYAVFLITFFLALAVPFDVYFAVNYGYVGDREPINPTLISKLGPWPWRLLPLSAIVIVGMYLIYVPWGLARMVSRRRTHARLEAGKCANCGYDLGGSKEICPECGSPAPGINA